MATPMKQGPSQQGKTPSQSQHGAAATPPVTTPFSASMAGHATGLTPHGPRSSPQQFKKSPATSVTLLGHTGTSAVNFDSPSAAAALGAMGMGGLDMNLDSVGGLSGLGSLGRNDEDERAKRLQTVIDILSKNKGLVSEAGLERLVKHLGMECMWEDDMAGAGAKPRTLIVAGSAIELEIVLLNDAVQSVSLAFPESADIVGKHAEEAGKILLDDLKLAPGQNPLTKRLDRFAANFELLATLDKLSVIPGLNLFEAIGGIYESLERLYRWDLQKVRENPAYSGKDDQYLANMVLCTRNGRPVMHTRDRVGLSVDYWKEKRLLPAAKEADAAYLEETEKTWGMLISCAPLKDISIPPVRVSDKWLSMEVEKVDGPEDLQPGSVVLDWLQPENTIIQPSEAAKSEADANGLGGDGLLVGPKYPEVVFKAILDPPLHVPINVWEEISQRGGALPSAVFMAHVSLDSLLFPVAPGSQQDPNEPRNITVTRHVDVCGTSGEADWSQDVHKNRLWIYRPVLGKTLTEIAFSHPQQIISILPLLRQYAFLSTILEKEFIRKEARAAKNASEEEVVKTTATTTHEDDYEALMAGTGMKGHELADFGDVKTPGLNVDVNFTTYPVPRLIITFPFQQRTASVTLEIQANGQVHIESQNVLDASNSTAPNGRQRRPEDLGKMLEVTEDIGAWIEFIRTRWA